MKIRVTVDAQSFDVEVGDLNARPIPVVVEGETFLVWPEEAAGAVPSAAAVPAHAAPAVAPAAVPTGAAANAKAMQAPIPGVIISLAVKEGDSISIGQEICNLEAMKMKNIIRANRAGKIAAIRVAAGDQVKRGQVLVEFTD